MNQPSTDYTQNIPTEVVLDSRTIELGRFFTGEDKSKLLVLVEDDDDKSFWENIFSCVKDYYSEINVWPLIEAKNNNQTQYNYEGDELLAKGKDALIQVQGLGKHKMIAVDADYDLLIDDIHSYSNDIRTKPFIQHTSYHSIENHLLDDRSFTEKPIIKHLCNTITNLLYFILGEEIHYIEDKRNGLEYTRKITINEFRGILGSYQYRPNSCIKDIDDLINNTLTKYNPITTPQSQTAKFKCESKGFYDTNIYQILQGHTLYEFIEKIITFELIERRKHKEEQIKNDATIDGITKGKNINELHKLLLGTAKNEKDFFHNQVYKCQYLNMHQPSILQIQNKIISEIKNNN